MKKTTIIILLFVTLCVADAVMCPVSKSYPGNLLRHKSSSITVLIRGQIVETIVESEFKNEWNQPTGGVYSFPLPLDANATGIWYDYNGNYYKAVLKEIPQSVNPGTGEGGFAAELNQYTGKNCINFKVDTIQPGVIQHIILRYIQKIPYTSGLLTYCYPLNSEKFQPQPVDYLKITVQINRSPAIKSFFSSSHPDGWVKSDSSGEYITLRYSEDKSYLQKDFVFHYETAYKSYAHETYAGIGSDSSGYFITSIYPGEAVDSSEIFPENVAFCIDISRSMIGTYLNNVCSSIKTSLSLLKSNDRFSIISFNDNITVHLNGAVPDTINLKRAAFILDSLQSMSVTNGSDLQSAINSALKTFTDDSSLNNILVFTDGFSPVTSENINNNKNAGIFPVGIGSDVSRERLEEIANSNSGFATFAPDNKSIGEKVQDLFKQINSPVIRQMKIVSEGSSISDLLPQSSCNAFYHGLGLLLMGRYSHESKTTFGFSGKSMKGDSSYIFTTTFPSDTLNETTEFVERMWAAEKIRSLERKIEVYGFTSVLHAEAVKTSLKYGVKSRYTSFWTDNTNVYTGKLPGELETDVKGKLSKPDVIASCRIILEKGILTLKLTITKADLNNGKAEITLFDVHGRIVARLSGHDLHYGDNLLRWDLGSRGIAAGTYYAVVKFGKSILVNKIELIR